MRMTMIKIALVDDHVILRESLAVLIEMLQGFEIVLQADNGSDFITKFPKSTIPDIVIMDISMPVMDGVQTSRWLKQNHPSIKVLAFSMIKNDFIIIRMLKNGARGYILKDCEPSELRQALNAIYEQGYYFNDLITPRMKPKSDNEDALMLPPFNEGELAFLRWACSEKTYKEIAGEMNVSHRTIDAYRDSLFKKLQVSSRIGIAMYAIKTGIVQI